MQVIKTILILFIVMFVGFSTSSCQKQEALKKTLEAVESDSGGFTSSLSDVVENSVNVLADAAVEFPDVSAATEAEEAGEELYHQVFISLYKPEGLDIILDAYRDPQYQELTLAFFAELCGSVEIASMILSNAAIQNISPSLAFSLCAEESAYNPQAINLNLNQTIDRGLFQLNSATFPQLKVVEFYDPGINSRYGLAHLRWCLDSAGSEVAGLAMYNAGFNKVRSIGAPKHTLDYISRILKRQREIEELFLVKLASIPPAEIEEPEQKKLFRLSLLTPLGGR